jgi:hypothetical protein
MAHHFQNASMKRYDSTMCTSNSFLVYWGTPFNEKPLPAKQRSNRPLIVIKAQDELYPHPQTDQT